MTITICCVEVESVPDAAMVADVIVVNHSRSIFMLLLFGIDEFGIEQSLNNIVSPHAATEPSLHWYNTASICKHTIICIGIMIIN